MSFEQLIYRAQIFFFCSGATGLIYQVLWTRRLTLTFGHTVLAISTVVTAYMAGLAIGSFLAGYGVDRFRASGRTHRLLRVYAALEAFVGIWAGATLPLLAYSETFYVWLASRGLSGLPLHLANFAAASVILVPPTIAMGATVPVLTGMLAETKAKIGAILSRLYGVNTLGALLGAALGGLVLLPTIGLAKSMIGAALVNLLIAAAAWRTGAPVLEATPKKGRGKKRSVPDDLTEERPNAWLVPLTFGLSGAASMGLQVAWNRSLALTIGSSVYAFSIILVVFLGGLGLGSLFYSSLKIARRPEPEHLAALYGLIGIGSALTIVALPQLPRAFLALFPLANDQFGVVLLIDLVLSGSVLILPTLAMGLAFPLATALYASSPGRLGKTVGTIYGANTLGCIAGAFISGFLLLPNVGAQATLVISTLLYLTCALALSLAGGSWRQRALRLTAWGAISLAVVAAPAWDTGRLASGVAVYAGIQKDGRPADAFFFKPAVYKDGLSSSVSFHLSGVNWDIPNMRVNGKVDASRGSGDRLTQYFLGYLPTLLHPKPTRVGVIGLGGGFTLEAVAQCPGVEQIDCAELEPAVLEMAEYWKPYNGRVLDDPRVNVHLTDGRTFVLADREKFDVLISEPSNPWIAGIGSLFTVDFYEIARSKLKPGGIMCQWFNIYAVDTDDMKMVLKGFFTVFPEGQLWQSSGGDLILIGSEEPTPFPLERVREAWRANLTMARHFFETQVYFPEYFAGHFLMTRAQVVDSIQDSALNTDDLPLLEFSAPLSLYNESEVIENRNFLFDLFEPAPPPGVQLDPSVQRGLFAGAVNREDVDYLQRNLERQGTSHPHFFSFAVRAKELESQADPTKTRNIYRGCLTKFPEDALGATNWGDFELTQGNALKAAELYLIALASPLPGSDAYLRQKVGEALLLAGDSARAVVPLMEAGERLPYESTPLSLAASALLGLKQDEDAMKVSRDALSRNGMDPLALLNLASAQFNLGQEAEARETLEKLVKLVPQYDLAWLRLGYIKKKQGDISGAKASFARAIDLNSEHQAAYDQLKW